MKPSFIQKRCRRCEKLYDIPNIRESEARENMLMHYPCTFCKFDDVDNKSGRCVECIIPFTITDEHAKGMCHRCYMIEWRKKNVTK